MKYETEKLEAFLNNFLEEKKVPGMSVCVNGPEGTIYKKGFGFRDAEKSKPVDTETIFGIASMSKSITCACLAILESEGKLSFNDPVYKYLPGLRIPGTPREALLVRHLANMTSGIPPMPTTNLSVLSNTENRPWIEPGVTELGKKMIKTPFATVEEIIEYISEGDYEHLGAPGEYMSYLNDGYALLSTIADIASGSTLEEFARERIFEPLGMTRTTFDIDEAKAMGNITSLFVADKDKFYSTDIWDAAPPFRGCGFIKSTSEDMCKYYGALACGGLLHGERVLPEGCVERLVGRAFPETAGGVYCFGLSKRVFRDTVLCEHSGGLTGVSSKGAFFKDRGYSATVLMNLGGVNSSIPLNAVINMLLSLPLDTSHVLSLPGGGAPERPEIYTGTYVSREEFPPREFEVSLNAEGGLCVEEPEGESELLFCNTTLFVISDGKNPIDQCRQALFYVRNGKAWAVKIGSRMLQRED